MGGPTKQYVCNQEGNECPELDSWYNGGISVYGRCKLGVWEGTKSWKPYTGCETPKNCPKIKENLDR